jgi:hypothetical protein
MIIRGEKRSIIYTTLYVLSYHDLVKLNKAGSLQGKR